MMCSFTNIHVMDMHKIYCNVHDILVFCDSIFLHGPAEEVV